MYRECNIIVNGINVVEIEVEVEVEKFCSLNTSNSCLVSGLVISSVRVFLRNKVEGKCIENKMKVKPRRCGQVQLAEYHRRLL